MLSSDAEGKGNRVIRGYYGGPEVRSESRNLSSESRSGGPNVVPGMTEGGTTRNLLKFSTSLKSKSEKTVD